MRPTDRCDLVNAPYGGKEDDAVVVSERRALPRLQRYSDCRAPPAQEARREMAGEAVPASGRISRRGLRKT